MSHNFTAIPNPLPLYSPSLVTSSASESSLFRRFNFGSVNGLNELESQLFVSVNATEIQIYQQLVDS